MFELVVTLCLLSDMTKCEEKHYQMEEGVSMMQCMTYGIQVATPQLIEASPKKFVKRWSCGAPTKSF